MSLGFCGSLAPGPHVGLSLSVQLGQGSVTSQPGGPNRDREEATRLKVGKRHLLRGIFDLSGSSSWGPVGIGAAGPESERSGGTLDLSPAVVLVLRCRIPHLSNHPFIPPPIPLSCPSTLMHASFSPSTHASYPPSILPFRFNISTSIHPSNRRPQPPNNSLMSVFSVQHHGTS